MIAMKAPETNVAVTAEKKDEARARILGALRQRGGMVEVDTYRELRDALNLNNMSMKLFKRSIWHLKTGDRDHEGKRRILLNEPEKLERFRSHTGRRISVRAL